MGVPIVDRLINLWEKMNNEDGMFKEDYHKKVHHIREGLKLDLPDGREATHLMTWGKVDDKYVAFPTLFPGYENPETELTQECGFLGTPEGVFPEEAYQLAKDRDELFVFNTSKEAEEWASPNAPWKNTE